jgi:hypothetical protein
MSHVPHQHRRIDDSESPTPPEGTTSEQLEYFTAATARAVRDALNRYSRRAVVGFVVLFAAFLANVFWENRLSMQGRDAIVASGRVIAVDGCNRDYVDREKFRDLLLRGQASLKLSLKAGNITQDQYDQGVEFYGQQLAAYPQLDCRSALHVITADPTKVTRTPIPCYPNNPQQPVDCAPTPVPKKASK